MDQINFTVSENLIMTAYIKILRPANVLLSAIGVVLGFWLADVEASILHIVLLITATVCAVGYGNVINDIKDIEGDKINHSNRPLVTGEITRMHAIYFTIALGVCSLCASYFVSINHTIATFIPILMLSIYTLYFKGVRVLGNLIVSVLVAYTLIFGALGSDKISIIIIPAFLAFLLNLCREIIKDIQDKRGDLESGVMTTATLSDKSLFTLMFIPGIIYIPLMFVPALLGHFHLTYVVICATVILPLHLYWFILIPVKNRMAKASLISKAIKIEMLGGLLALAFDKIVTNTLTCL